MRNFSTDAGRKANEPFAIFAEQFLIHPRIVVVALCIPFGDEFSQVAVASRILRQQHEVIRGMGQTARGFAQVPALDGNVHFTAYDGLNTNLFTGLVVLYNSEQIAVISDRHGRHTEFGCRLCHLSDTTAPIQ